MTEPQEIIRDDLIKELKEQHNEQMNAVLIHPEVYKYLTRKSHKKIKRRLSYDVYYWTKTDRISKYFESAKKAKNYVNYIHNSNLIEDGEVVEMVKTWCYREFTPRHKWYYVSYYPNQFVCVEKY
jgi:ribosomal protein S19E (S16A)